MKEPTFTARVHDGQIMLVCKGCNSATFFEGTLINMERWMYDHIVADHGMTKYQWWVMDVGFALGRTPWGYRLGNRKEAENA